MSINPLKLLEDLINEHGSSSILRERLLLVKDELGKVEKERADLQRQLAEAMEKLRYLREEVKKKSVPENFTEYRGALFKRDVSGRHAPLAHCPECKRPLVNTDPCVFPYNCTTPGCRYEVTIKEDLELIAQRLDHIAS